jgi:hypothetical protein
MSGNQQLLKKINKRGIQNGTTYSHSTLLEKVNKIIGKIFEGNEQNVPCS